MHRIAISGLVALAAVLGGVAVPAAAMAQPAAAVRPASAVAARTADAAFTTSATLTPLIARVADNGEIDSGQPLISCVLTTDCLGVQGGAAIEGGTGTPVGVARWNGSSWKGVRFALPKGASAADLNDVSCKGAKSCLVVGDYYTSTNGDDDTHALALIYNGTSLRPTPAVPLPKGATDASLIDVSCLSSTHCVALGQADGNVPVHGAYSPLTLIETWNGKKWTVRTVDASSATASTDVTDLSCATSAFCVLTGEITPFAGSGAGNSKLYLASWNGKKLTTMKMAAGASAEPAPISVSCATPSNCALTGYYLFQGGVNSPPSVTSFTEIWNGKAWRLAKVTWPADLPATALFGVSCYGAHSCEAVGLDGMSLYTPLRAAAVSFTGTASKIQAVPAPGRGDENMFSGVSCLPWGSCVAVGETGSASSENPNAVMTGIWNGKAWQLKPGF